MYTDYQASLDGLKKQYEQLEQLAAQRSGLVEASAPPQHVPRVSNGIVGAREFKLGKDSDVAIFDVNEDVFYFRKTDVNGNELPLKIGRYTLEDPPKSENDYVTMKDFQALKTEIIGLLSDRADKVEQKKPAKKEAAE